jgi:hypothetical protein
MILGPKADGTFVIEFRTANFVGRAARGWRFRTIQVCPKDVPITQC